MGVKEAPERFQDCKDWYDIVVTFEESVMNQVVEGKRSRVIKGLRQFK